MIIKFTIDRFENNQAVLIDEQGKTVVWPKNKLPDNLREGSALNFEIMEAKGLEEKNKQTAKDILNEIINPTSVGKPPTGDKPTSVGKPSQDK